jgi:hypothetical protein
MHALQVEYATPLDDKKNSFIYVSIAPSFSCWNGCWVDITMPMTFFSSLFIILSPHFEDCAVHKKF